MTSDHGAMDSPSVVDIYAATRAELIAFARAASPELVGTMVPATPAWSVRDIFAHVVGINTDMLDQNLEGVGSDAWTEAQLEKRAGQSIDDICDEWESVAPRFDEFGASTPDMALGATADLITHLHDIGGAIDKQFDRRGDGVMVTLGRYCDRYSDRLAAAGLADIRIVADDVDWSSTEPTAGQVTLSGTAFELIRAMTGRRSSRQVDALDWSGDHEAHRGLISAYGSRSTDLIE